MPEGRKVTVLRPKLHKEIKEVIIGQCRAGRACVVVVPRLQGVGDRLAHPGREWHHATPYTLMVRQLPCVIPSSEWMTRAGCPGSVPIRQ